MPDRKMLCEGGYCFDCRIAFADEGRADAHYAMTGHQIGWPFEDVDWPLATEAQIYPGPASNA